jgi:glucosamine--fructose-6-phosphate aminotransferase (isomerizing)
MATRESDGTIYTHAGPEIGVASTKAFTSQLVALHLLALTLGQARGTTIEAMSLELVRQLDQLPLRIEEALGVNDAIEELSASVQNRRDCLYLGRGINYPIALEGALKLKEISYIHAEGYPAGEMKHGPIALIEEDLPVIVLAADDGLFEKVVGNVQEAKARGGRIIAVTTRSRVAALEQVLTPNRDVILAVPDVHPLLVPVLLTIPVQLLAYHVAVRRGCDVDQPRNLAKSVTVE